MIAVDLTQEQIRPASLLPIQNIITLPPLVDLTDSEDSSSCSSSPIYIESPEQDYGFDLQEGEFIELDTRQEVPTSPILVSFEDRETLHPPLPAPLITIPALAPFITTIPPFAPFITLPPLNPFPRILPARRRNRIDYSLRPRHHMITRSRSRSPPRIGLTVSL
mgnify:CR=1 FL=1